MPDREKVIKGLECCSNHIIGTSCKKCPYEEEKDCEGSFSCTDELAHDALALLKEQEAEWLEVDDKHDAFDCSNCGAMAGRKCLYCPGCGAKMKNGTRAMEGR